MTGRGILGIMYGRNLNNIIGKDVFKSKFSFRKKMLIFDDLKIMFQNDPLIKKKVLVCACQAWL